MINYIANNTIKLIRQEYLKDNLNWSIGFSGGKDSSALLKLTFQAMLTTKKKEKKINVVYCDTGVEIPIMAKLVDNTFKILRKEAKEYKLPFNCIKLSPKISDRYFVKVIGRGYPPPTNIFRWCTDKLRVIPIQTFIKNHSYENIILLGVRKGESVERDKVILKHYLENIYYFKQSNYKQAKIFSPILNFNESNVWEVILDDSLPKSIDGRKLKKYYTLVKNENENKLGGRFGCWTCTVVRKDKAIKNLIDAGYTNLIPLMNFRDWLISIRDKTDFRCKHRRNGIYGLGPFTLETRLCILDKLLKAQNESKYSLISEEEIDYIYYLWDIDKKSNKYVEN
ncbi:MAG: phosphoadenosine phosphosulfate reductase family protein [Ignavibacteriaceae bacterium]|nr:phosphoadenosine phosphosulfate reductase family protein [Ignavibacteriaceae bacterium]